MKPTNFDLLRVLVTVAESKNFRDAAETLQISQPGVSLKLKELESQQPFPLFSLEGKRKVLTHYGRSLYELAKQGTAVLERKIEDLHRMYASPELLTLRVGGRSEVLEHMAPFLEFAGRIEYTAYSSKESIARLLRHEIDIAFTYVRPDSAELQAKRVFQSKAYFTVHEKFLKKKLSRALIESHEFLRETPCVAYTRAGHLIAEYTSHHGLAFDQLKLRHAAEDWRTIRTLAEQGAGFAILPSYAQSSHPDMRSLEVPESVLPSLEFFAVFESGLKKIEAFRELLSFARVPKD